MHDLDGFLVSRGYGLVYQSGHGLVGFEQALVGGQLFLSEVYVAVTNRRHDHNYSVVTFFNL